MVNEEKLCSEEYFAELAIKFANHEFLQPFLRDRIIVDHSVIRDFLQLIFQQIVELCNQLSLENQQFLYSSFKFALFDFFKDSPLHFFEVVIFGLGLFFIRLLVSVWIGIYAFLVWS